LVPLIILLRCYNIGSKLKLLRVNRYTILEVITPVVTKPENRYHVNVVNKVAILLRLCDQSEKEASYITHND